MSYINKLLFKLFGEDARGERRARTWFQNLNEDRNGEPKGWAYEGRSKVYFDGKAVFSFSWNLWTHFCGASLRLDPSEDGLKFHAALPPVAFWWGFDSFGMRPIRKFLESPRMAKWNESAGGHKGSNRYTTFEVLDISIHDWTLFWSFLKFDWGWSRKMPKWMSGSLNFTDLFLGRLKCETEVVETKDVKIPMPEGLYPAKAKMEKRTRSRPRWFSKESYSVWLDIPHGIPHAGKGESDYNCGEDGLFGCGAEGTRYEAAIARAIESVLGSRRKYNGSLAAVYPDPAKRPPPIPPVPNQGEASA